MRKRSGCRYLKFLQELKLLSICTNFKNMKNLAILFILCFGVNMGFAQDGVTLWRLDENPQHQAHHSAPEREGAIQQDNDNYYPCGTKYYQGLPVGWQSVQSYWSIKNENDVAINLQLPLTMTGATNRFTIVSQPSKSNLAPGEEVFFIVEYYGEPTGGVAWVEINSDAPKGANCSMGFDGGRICDYVTDFMHGGLMPIGGPPPIPISILDPCGLGPIGPAIVENIWTGDGDGMSWEDPGNWILESVPDFGEVVVIMDDTVMINSASARCNSILVIDAEIIVKEDAELNIADAITEFAGGGVFNSGLNLNASIFTNNGLTTVTNGAGDGIVMINGSEFTNNGTVDINNIDDDAIDIDASVFINNDSLFIFETDDDAIDIDGDGEFINRGYILLEEVDDEGFDMAGDNARVDNYGTIIIEGDNEDTDDGIDLDGDGAIFYNHAEGVLTIKDTDGDLIDMEATFINDGEINLIMGDENSDAIDIDATFEFTNNGIINIVGSPSTDEMIDMAGIFRNNGIINMTGSLDNGDEALEVNDSAARFINSECAIVNIEDNEIEIESDAILTNSGIIASAFTGTNINDGTFNNFGKIVTPSGTFLISPNALGGTGPVESGAVPVTESLCEAEPLPALPVIPMIVFVLLIIGLSTRLIDRSII